MKKKKNGKKKAKFSGLPTVEIYDGDTVYGWEPIDEEQLKRWKAFIFKSSWNDNVIELNPKKNSKSISLYKPTKKDLEDFLAKEKELEEARQGLVAYSLYYMTAFMHDGVEKESFDFFTEKFPPDLMQYCTYSAPFVLFFEFPLDVVVNYDWELMKEEKMVEKVSIEYEMKDLVSADRASNAKVKVYFIKSKSNMDKKDLEKLSGKKEQGPLKIEKGGVSFEGNNLEQEEDVLLEAQPLNMVAEFHRFFDHPIEAVPTLIAKERSDLRINLLQEELNELKKAVEEKDLVEIADALVDLQYVLTGAVLEWGFAEYFGALFAEVHSSNMTKACLTAKDIADTEAFLEARGEDFHSSMRRVGNISVMTFRRNGDDKIFKNVNYKEPRLKEFLQQFL